MTQTPDLIIKKIDINEEVISLVWKVFLEFEAPDYSQEGIEMFKDIIHDDEYLSQLSCHGAYGEGKLLGVIATRQNNYHIALFFVDGNHHKEGIGRRLFEAAKFSCSSPKMTVHSSPFAVPVYGKMGFVQTDNEQIENGIRFTPMEMKLTDAK